MARIDFWMYMLDSNGIPLQNAEVRVYLANTLNEADIYLDSKFGSSTKSSTEDLKTDSYGFIRFWVGDRWEVEGGYNTDQQFRIIWQNDVDSIQEEINNFSVFAPVRPIDISDNIIGVPSNKDYDKVISNSQGYKWNFHVDSILPSGSPHGMEPATFFNLDETKNKTISNKVAYQMYKLAELSSTTGIDVSASRFYSEEVSSWTSSGGIYYKDITHNFSNYYPIVKVSKTSIADNRDYQIKPKRIKSLNENEVRVWLENNIGVVISIYG